MLQFPKVNGKLESNAINYLWRLSFHNIRQFPFIELEYERANSFGVI